MFERIKNMVIKEFIQTFRDKRMRFFLFVPPMIQLFAFGYVVSLDVNYIPTAWYDLDNSSESRELARRFSSSGYFAIEQAPRSEDEIRDLLDATVDTKWIFRKAYLRQSVIVDGADSEHSHGSHNYAASIIGAYSRDLAAAGAGRIIEDRPPHARVVQSDVAEQELCLA
jgi:ABC-2 type transport system permease protein